MKTIVNVGGSDFVLPKTVQPADMVKLLELMTGARQVHHRTIYGPDGDAKYDDKYYRSVEVMEDRPVKIRIEQVADEDVLSQADFGKLERDIKEQIARDFPQAEASKKNLPVETAA